MVNLFLQENINGTSACGPDIFLSTYFILFKSGLLNNPFIPNFVLYSQMNLHRHK